MEPIAGCGRPEERSAAGTPASWHHEGCIHRRRPDLSPGPGRRVKLDQSASCTRELQLLGFIMSAITAGELAGAAAWINARRATDLLTVSLALPVGFADAARAHAMTERGELPPPRRPHRRPDGPPAMTRCPPSAGRR